MYVLMSFVHNKVYKDFLVSINCFQISEMITDNYKKDKYSSFLQISQKLLAADILKGV